MNKFHFMRGDFAQKRRVASTEDDPSGDKIIGDFDWDRSGTEWGYCNLQMYFMMQQVIPSRKDCPSSNGSELDVGR